jgi:nitric oxide reductase subunit B
MGLWLAVNYGFTLPKPWSTFSPSPPRALHRTCSAWLPSASWGNLFHPPEECERELFSVKLAWLQLVLFAGAAVAAVVGFLFGWTQGKPLLEIPVPLDRDRRRGADRSRERRADIASGAALADQYMLAAGCVPSRCSI